ncbi:hypothetical protein ACHJH3_06395 [Campylobacter sp. MOP7]|uniref:hypothetical protein n=1 Tax=Campylobacter canis TaxID=3378588 RepID=UPI00387E4B01
MLRKIQKKKSFLAIFWIVVVIATSTTAYANGVADRWAQKLDTGVSESGTSFSALRQDLEGKIGGNLGLLMGLLGFVGTFIAYIFTHKGSVLFTGGLLSLIAGGLTGIISYFFNVGTSGFSG